MSAPQRFRRVTTLLRPVAWRQLAPFVVRSYRRLLGRRPSPKEIAARVHWLRTGHTKGELLTEIAHSEEYVGRLLKQVMVYPAATAESFIEELYAAVLNRPPDADGRAYYLSLLGRGFSREDLARKLIGSDEHVNRVTAAVFGLPSLRKQWPKDYLDVVADNGQPVTVFRCARAEDFDRLESAILDNGYYEKPGIWGFELNKDKRVVAEMIGLLEPARVLEIGCSNGTVLQCLAERGVMAEGVEISQSAIAKADPAVRDAIHFGDLLTADLTGPYDVVFGLDIFEHLNPNRIDAYLARAVSLLRNGGYLFTNVPAFGCDPVFGTVFPTELPGWRQDAAAGRPFSLLPVDEDGYPHHGHLIWAEAAWWVTRFERAGLCREEQLERPLHARYDDFFNEAGPARRAFFVFSHRANAEDVAALSDRIRRGASQLV